MFFFVSFFSLIDKWSPALQIRTVLLSIQALLSAPNPDDPLANDVAELWKVNEVEAIRNAREWTRTYAMGNIWKSKRREKELIIQSMAEECVELRLFLLYFFVPYSSAYHGWFPSPYYWLDISTRKTTILLVLIIQLLLFCSWEIILSASHSVCRQTKWPSSIVCSFTRC